MSESLSVCRRPDRYALFAADDDENAVAVIVVQTRVVYSHFGGGHPYVHSDYGVRGHKVGRGHVLAQVVAVLGMVREVAGVAQKVQRVRVGWRCRVWVAEGKEIVDQNLCRAILLIVLPDAYYVPGEISLVMKGL